VNDRENGNISLRRPGYVGAKGQPFLMDDHQYRLVLQYQSGAGRWVELQRNNLSPDYYWPTSVDEFFDGDQRRYNSVWQAGKSQRTWRVTGKAALGDNLDAFDIAMQTFMQRRNIPNGSLALTVDGRLVLARGYSWDLPAVDAAEPDALFRTASVSKPLTAIGIMRLVQQRKLNLDWRLIDVPGFNAVLKSGDWTDQRIRNATVRDLLHHLGGWDRSDGVGDFMIMDWEVCKNHGPLATDRTKILNYGRTKKLDYAPGTTHFYSNFGYMLLGKIIETVSGQSYYNFMRDQVLTPSGAGASQIGGNFGGAKNEVRYYRPDNRMGGLVTGPSMIDPPPAYDPCNANHAFLTPVPYGNLNIPPMDAHGGWIASGVEMMKILRSLDNNTLLGPDLRREMWSQPDGRSRRMLAYDAGSGAYTDVTLALRATGGASVIPIDGIGDILIVGRGLNRFGRIDLNFTTPGDGYTLQVIYPSSEGGWKPLTGTDNTQSFTENGSMTFTAPLDWTVATLPMLDEHPRYYVMIYSTTVPTTAARIDRALPSGETTYSLGWDWSATQDTVRHTLRYQNRIGSLSVGSQVVGEISKATASIGADAPTDTKSGLLTIINLVGGPFYPGEKLLIGNNVVATAAERDWMMDANMRHGGLLWGTRATLQHRSNGVNWSILFNQDNAYDPYWYLPGEGGINGAIWNLVDEFVAENKWPAFDLFGQYP
jgi:CubicO group peptidase (beta-lactamase class C family)